MVTLYQSFLGLSLPEYYDSHFEVTDQAKARACLEKWSNLPCEDTTRSDPECDDVFRPKNPASAGQKCGGEGMDSIECNNNLMCVDVANKPDCGVCEAKKANGTSCTDSDECQSGFCSGGNSPTCGPAAPKPKGQGCTRDDECLGSLVCVGSGNAKTCQERVGLNAACDGPRATAETRPPCYADLECVSDSAGVNGTCAASLPDGATCQREPGYGSTCRHYCVFTSANAVTGTCQTLAALPGAGQPCVGFGSAAIFCSQDDAIYADFEFTYDSSGLHFTSCGCKTKVGQGGQCLWSSACNNGLCSGQDFTTTPMTPGTCGPLLANGTACEDDDECVSGYCQVTGQNGTCAPPPACP
jgi:hypothetical protein